MWMMFQILPWTLKLWYNHLLEWLEQVRKSERSGQGGDYDGDQGGQGAVHGGTPGGHSPGDDSNHNGV